MATHLFLLTSAFNKIWNAKLEEKRAVEAQAEKAARAKAAEDMQNWTTQRDIRLHAKKVRLKGHSIFHFCERLIRLQI